MAIQCYKTDFVTTFKYNGNPIKIHLPFCIRKITPEEQKLSAVLSRMYL